MAKRGIGDDFERQPGDYRDGDNGDSNSNLFTGSNFGGPAVSGRKILQPKRLRGARPVTPKPLPPQPQAQAQPVTANTGGFGFTFGGGATPAPSTGGFNFTSQQPVQQTTGIFGAQQSSTPSTGFSFTPSGANNPFQTSATNAAAVASNSGFQGSIFSIQPPAPPTQGGFASSFSGFGGQSSAQPATNIFGNSQPSENRSPFGSQPEQPKNDFVFGQSTNPTTGFGGTNSQSASAPSSFTFNNSTSPAVEQAAPPASTSFSFGASNQQSSTASNLSATTATTRAASPFSFGATSQPSMKSSIFSSTTQPEVGQQASSATTTAAQAAPLFSFTNNSAGSQNPFATMKTQTEEPAKTPLFGFTAPTTTAASPLFPSTATSSAPTANEPLFKVSEGNKTATPSIFGAISSQPSSSTIASSPSLFGPSHLYPSQPSAITAALSSTERPTSTGSIFGSLASTPSATIKDANQNVDVPSAAAKPLFSFKPAVSQGEKKTGTDTSAPLFGSSSAASGTEKGPVGIGKTPLFGAPASSSNKEASQMEQKPLPSFTFGGTKTDTTSSPFKTSNAALPSPTKPKDSGLFQPPTSSGSIFQTSQNTSGSLFASQQNKDTSKPLFSVSSSGLADQSSAAKPMFGFANTSAPSASPLFSASNSTPLEKLVQEGAAGTSPFKSVFSQQGTTTSSGSIFGTAPQNNTNTKSSESQAPAKSPFTFAPNVNNDSSGNTNSSSDFRPAAEIQQTVASNKSPVKSAPAPSKDQVNGTSATSETSQAIAIISDDESSVSTAQDEPSTPVSTDAITRNFDIPPSDVPEGIFKQWTKLRSGDLPMDETVDILLHDWILQIEIPRDVFDDMTLDQEDEIKYMWHHNTVDAVWAAHLESWGDIDRNLLEVYRIVLDLKEAIDQVHKRVWDPSDSLADPKIFEERDIKRMARKNIQNYETGLKSEIKNLKKRKIDTMRDDASGEADISNDAKRSKVGKASKVGVAKEQPTPAPTQLSPQNRNKRSFVEDRTSSDPIRSDKRPRSSEGEQGATTASSQLNNNQNKSDASANIFGAPKPSLRQESPSKANLFAASKSTAEESSSPQKSKTSQLFASIANKPVEDSPAVPNQATSGKSLFDRISRDSNGDPLRELSASPPVATTQEIQNESEQDGSKEEEELEDYEDDEEDESDEEDRSSTEEVVEQSKAANIFGQSYSAGAQAKEATSGASGDHTWKPESPIRFSKNTKESASTASPSKPSIGFVPSGGMPKNTSSSGSTPEIIVSSQDTWKAPANPFGNFKNIGAKPDTKKSDRRTPSAPKFEMPKPPASSVSEPAPAVSSMDTWKAPANPFGNFKNISAKPNTKKPDESAPSAPKFEMPKPPASSASEPAPAVSSMDTWKAPANPFGLFKKAESKPVEATSVAPALTITAPSPQRPAQSLFGNVPSMTEQQSDPSKNLFGFSSTVQPSSVAPGEKKTSAPSIFGSANAFPTQSIFGAPTSAPNKPLFDISKNEVSSTAAAPVSNHWLDFVKQSNKPSSPAPSGASVFASLNTSLNPSRASSPAMSAVSTAAGDTDADHNDDDDAPKEAQLDLGTANAGEEHEELLQSIRAKVHELYGMPGEKKEWTVRGVGELRVLKHKDTGKVRALLRADQSAKVLLNAGLISAASYTLMSPKRVNFTVATADGVPTRWFIQVGKEDDAKKLSDIFEQNKAN